MYKYLLEKYNESLLLRTSFICFIIKDEVISLEDKIMLLINGRMDQNSYEECQSIQLSKELKLSSLLYLIEYSLEILHFIFSGFFSSDG